MLTLFVSFIKRISRQTNKINYGQSQKSVYNQQGYEILLRKKIRIL